jgi:hypothetical protein
MVLAALPACTADTSDTEEDIEPTEWSAAALDTSSDREPAEDDYVDDAEREEGTTGEDEGPASPDETTSALTPDCRKHEPEKPCTRSTNHTCALRLNAGATLHASPTSAASVGFVRGGKVIEGATGMHCRREGVVTLNRGIWRDVGSERFYFAWLARVCPTASDTDCKHRSGWIARSVLKDRSKADAQVTAGRKDPLGTNDGKGGGPTYVVRPDRLEQIRESYALQKCRTDAGLGWHYTDKDGDGLVYITDKIAAAGIDRVPAGGKFIVDTDDGRVRVVQRRVYDAATCSENGVGFMLFLHGHAEGSKTHGWMAASNLAKATGARLKGFSKNRFAVPEHGASNRRCTKCKS